MKTEAWKWVVGLIYILAVATIWIAASFVVQSVVDEGVPPFIVTYICNSLFVLYIPLVEIGRYLGDKYGSLLFWQSPEGDDSKVLKVSEQTVLLKDSQDQDQAKRLNLDVVSMGDDVEKQEEDVILGENVIAQDALGLDKKGRWTRTRIAKVSLLICPIWFLAQLSFNLSLKYTTVTSNTILSSASSLFTFLVALAFLGEKFTWLKLFSVLLCMAGTGIVSWGDRGESSSFASNPVLGDILALLSSAFYAVYITLIRQKLPDEDDTSKGHASMAQFLGFLGFFNLLIFLPVALILYFARLENLSSLTWKHIGLIVGKGLLDNVLSDYLWAKAVLLTTTTVATAGLSIQVPLAAIVDLLRGHNLPVTNYVGAAAVMVGFAGMNIAPDALSGTKEVDHELERGNANSSGHEDL